MRHFWHDLARVTFNNVYPVLLCFRALELFLYLLPSLHSTLLDFARRFLPWWSKTFCNFLRPTFLLLNYLIVLLQHFGYHFYFFRVFFFSFSFIFSFHFQFFFNYRCFSHTSLAEHFHHRTNTTWLRPTLLFIRNDLMILSKVFCSDRFRTSSHHVNNLDFNQFFRWLQLQQFKSSTRLMALAVRKVEKRIAGAESTSVLCAV